MGRPVSPVQFKQVTAVSLLMTKPGNDGRHGQVPSNVDDDRRLLTILSVQLLCTACWSVGHEAALHGPLVLAGILVI